MQSGLNPLMAAAVDYLAGPETNRRHDSSATWTTSSGDRGNFSDPDETEDRVHFVDEYNRLAKEVCLCVFGHRHVFVPLCVFGHRHVLVPLCSRALGPAFCCLHVIPRTHC